MRLLIVFILSTIGFTTYAQLGPLPPISKKEVLNRLELLDFDYELDVTSILSELAENTKVTKRKLKYINNSNGDKREFDVDIYVANKFSNKKLPVIIIFPPLRGISVLDKAYAKYFSKQGYLVVISQLNEEILELPSISYVMDAFVSSMADNMVLLEYLSNHKNADLNKLGVFGVSLGGIRSSMIFNIDDRFKAGVSVVGGGNLPGIMAFSSHKKVVKLRNKFMKDNDLTTQEQYEQTLRDHLVFDPLYFKNLHKKLNRDYYLIVGMKDKAVNTDYQLELKDSFNDPLGYSVNGGHKKTSATSFMNKKRIRDYFSKHLM